MLSKEQKAMVREAYDRDVWHGNDRMTDYCSKKVSSVAMLPDGNFIPVDKQSLQKHFCFGYSLSQYDSESFDRANEMARKAAEDASYFKNENMRDFERSLRALKDCMEKDWPESFALIALRPYYGQPEGSPLKGLTFLRAYELIEACGGSCFRDELPGKVIEYRGSKYRVPTADELAEIYRAYEEASKEHEKRVDTYLKKYGMKHVETWSYWQDA